MRLQNRCHLLKLDPQWPSFVQDYSQQTTGAAEIDSWEEVLPTPVTQQDYDCKLNELPNTDENPPKMFDYDTMPMWPYPRALPIVGTGLRQGEILQTRTWAECKELCQKTPGCVYVYRPGSCKSVTPGAPDELVHTTWTDDKKTENYGQQCFMYNTYNERVASAQSKTCTPYNWDSSCESNVPSHEYWRSKDWCHGSQFRSDVLNGVVGNAVPPLDLGQLTNDGYDHAVSSCANTKFQYSSYTFGHPDETTTGIS